jgi:hypothetical protein
MSFDKKIRCPACGNDDNIGMIETGIMAYHVVGTYENIVYGGWGRLDDWTESEPLLQDMHPIFKCFNGCDAEWTLDDDGNIRRLDTYEEPTTTEGDGGETATEEEQDGAARRAE